MVRGKCEPEEEESGNSPNDSKSTNCPRGKERQDASLCSIEPEMSQQEEMSVTAAKVMPAQCLS